MGDPTHPGEGQVHLQLSDAATNAGTDPIAKRDGAEGVVGGTVSPEPALGQEALRLGKVGLVMGHGIVCQDKEGLWGEKGLMPSDAVGYPQHSPHSHSWGRGSLQ